MQLHAAEVQGQAEARALSEAQSAALLIGASGYQAYQPPQAPASEWTRYELNIGPSSSITGPAGSHAGPICSPLRLSPRPVPSATAATAATAAAAASAAAAYPSQALPLPITPLNTNIGSAEEPLVLDDELISRLHADLAFLYKTLHGLKGQSTTSDATVRLSALLFKAAASSTCLYYPLRRHGATRLSCTARDFYIAVHQTHRRQRP
jgi:hypothetical protein